jgi:TrbL/VirB6 plasmid conjugal transfer protein
VRENERRMTDFNSIFPNFVNQCVQLKQLLTPIAFLLLTAGLISSIVSGQKSGDAYMRAVARTLVLVVVLTFLVSWGNTITSAVDSTVKNVLKVDPTQIFTEYRDALDMQKSNESGNQSWWEKVFSIRATIFESLISGFLWLLGWIASGIVFFAYIIQKIILYMGYALAPIFVGFLAIRSLYDIGKRYFLNLVGVMLWPLGWGVAALITQGLIDFMTDRSFLHTPIVMVGVIPTTGSDAYSFQNFLGAGLLGIWLIFSTIAAPVIIGRSISAGSLAGASLTSGAATAGRSAVATAATVGTSIASGGGGLAVAAGAIVGAGAGLESLVATSAGSGGGSLIGSLVSARSRGGGQKNQAGQVANPPFRGDDLTGDKAVAETLRKAKK